MSGGGGSSDNLSASLHTDPFFEDTAVLHGAADLDLQPISVVRVLEADLRLAHALLPGLGAEHGAVVRPLRCPAAQPHNEGQAFLGLGQLGGLLVPRRPLVQGLAVPHNRGLAAHCDKKQAGVTGERGRIGSQPLTAVIRARDVATVDGHAGAALEAAAQLQAGRCRRATAANGGGSAALRTLTISMRMGSNTPGCSVSVTRAFCRAVVLHASRSPNAVHFVPRAGGSVLCGHHGSGVRRGTKA